MCFRAEGPRCRGRAISPRRAGFPFWFLLLLLTLAPPVLAVQGLALDVGDVAGAGWRVQGLRVALDLPAANGTALTLFARQAELESPRVVLRNLEIRCPRASLGADRVECRDGRLSAKHPWLDRPEARVEAVWTRAGGLELEVKGLALAGGDWDLRLVQSGPLWSVTAKGQRTDAARLLALLPEYAPALKGWTGRGRLDLSLEGRLDDRGLVQGKAELQTSGLGFEDPAGRLLGDALTGGIGLEATRAEAGTSAVLTLDLDSGELLTPYFYLAPAGATVALRADLGLSRDGRVLEVRGLDYLHPGVLGLTGAATLSLEPPVLRRLRLETGQFQAAAVHGNYLQPVLAGTLLERVAWQGEAVLSLDYRKGGSARLVLDLEGLGLADVPDPALSSGAAPRFALRDLSGRLAWTEGVPAEPTRLRIGGGHLLDTLEIGAAELEAELSGRGFRLLRPLELPILDGALLVDRLEVALPTDAAPVLEFDGVLTPLSMERLSRAFGWPEMGGTLSGVLPRLSYRDDALRVGGNLLVRVFDGEVLIRDLRLGGLLGSLPVLEADLEARGLDLETLTRTFSFGKITGRLDGRVQALRLEGWRPVAFDARFATPEDDPTPHRINQRAVDNLSSLGGAGLGASLSRGFLGLFEEFRYDRLGIACRLENGVCHLDGVAPAERGYYLATGSGIPQISIVGFNRRADWGRLLGQLRQISAGGEPVVR